MLPDNFWAKVRKTEECWEWTGTRYPFGYGIFYVKGKKRLAHRLSWADVNGEIPEGLFICHTCDNPPCVRPDHLFLGTTQENTRDRCRKGRTTKNNARLTEDQVRSARVEYTGRRGEIAALARKYNVTRTAMQWILTGGSWADVDSTSVWSAAGKYNAPPEVVGYIQARYTGQRGEIAAFAREYGISKYVARNIARAGKEGKQ